MTQKAKVGGTPGRAPLGYRNVTQEVEGRDVKLVEVDEERAAHVRWAFEMYATGEWTVPLTSPKSWTPGHFAPLPRGGQPVKPVHYGPVAAGTC